LRLAGPADLIAGAHVKPEPPLGRSVMRGQPAALLTPKPVGANGCSGQMSAGRRRSARQAW